MVATASLVSSSIADCFGHFAVLGILLWVGCLFFFYVLSVVLVYGSCFISLLILRDPTAVCSDVGSPSELLCTGLVMLHLPFILLLLLQSWLGDFLDNASLPVCKLYSSFPNRVYPCLIEKKKEVVASACLANKIVCSFCPNERWK